MTKKMVAIFIFCSFLSFSGFGQIRKENTKRPLKDFTKNEGGKADVYIIGKPIFDPVSIQKEVSNLPSGKIDDKKKPTYKKKKRSKCKHKV